MALSFEIQNQKVAEWAANSQRLMQAAGNALGITHRSNSPSKSASLPKVRSRLLYADAAIRGVAFRFPRSLIYPHTGSGKGHGGAKGSRWKDSFGISKSTNPASFNKRDSGNRKAKPFIKNTLDIQVPVLATIVAETSADIVTANLFKQ